MELVTKLCIIVGVVMLACSACQHVKLEGDVGGNDRGARNSTSIVTTFSDRVKARSKISQPYQYKDPRFTIPDNSEWSIEITF